MEDIQNRESYREISDLPARHPEKLLLKTVKKKPFNPDDIPDPNQIQGEDLDKSIFENNTLQSTKVNIYCFPC